MEEKRTNAETRGCFCCCCCCCWLLAGVWKTSGRDLPLMSVRFDRSFPQVDAVGHSSKKRPRRNGTRADLDGSEASGEWSVRDEADRTRPTRITARCRSVRRRKKNSTEARPSSSSSSCPSVMGKLGSITDRHWICSSAAAGCNVGRTYPVHQ